MLSLDDGLQQSTLVVTSGNFGLKANASILNKTTLKYLIHCITISRRVFVTISYGTGSDVNGPIRSL
jgi:hypothetical protein